MRSFLLRTWILGMLAVFLLGGMSMLTPLQAQTTHSTPPKKSFVQRHPKLTSVAAGIVAYKVAKKTGKNRQAAGRKRNFAQRHPVLTGIAAAAATHHYIKKHTPKH